MNKMSFRPLLGLFLLNEKTAFPTRRKMKVSVPYWGFFLLNYERIIAVN